MSKSLSATLTLATLSLFSCVPPYDPYAPPPRFRPNPPYAPQEIDPYEQDSSPDPYGSFNSRPGPAAAPAPLAPTPPAAGSYPTATRTTNPNQVLSPYAPYNVIDVEGFQSGKLARDPSNQKIFRVP